MKYNLKDLEKEIKYAIKILKQVIEMSGDKYPDVINEDISRWSFYENKDILVMFAGVLLGIKHVY